MPDGYVSNHDQLEMGVSGPGEANRLYIVTGSAVLGRHGMVAEAEENLMETWTFHVGPALSHSEFLRAIGNAWVFNHAIRITPVSGASNSHAIRFESVEADWDDEHSQTEVRVEVRLQSGPGVHQILSLVGFNVSILAQK